MDRKTNPSAVLPQADDPKDDIHVNEVDDVQSPDRMLDTELAKIGQRPPISRSLCVGIMDALTKGGAYDERAQGTARGEST